MDLLDQAKKEIRDQAAQGAKDAVMPYLIAVALIAIAAYLKK